LGQTASTTNENRKQPKPATPVNISGVASGERPTWVRTSSAFVSSSTLPTGPVSMARHRAPKPASSGKADSDRVNQYGCEALTDSIHADSPCQSWPCTSPAAVRSATIKNSPIASSQKVQLAAPA
jgi:hypothetical protein